MPIRIAKSSSQSSDLETLGHHHHHGQHDVLQHGDADMLDFYSRYLIGEVLGRGASSVVRQCTEKESGVDYAVKIIDISGQNMSDQDIRELCISTRQEVEILHLLAGHRNIIELHDVFESATFFFLVFELCPGGELFDYLNHVVVLSEKQTRRVMRQLFDAVAYMHAKGVCHRDLKLENILLDADGNLKVTDFGFAAIVDAANPGALRDLCGTPGYLAPEVLKTNMTDVVSGYHLEIDLWACGVIMYTLLAGYPPFWNRRQMIMMRLIMEGKFSFDAPEWEDATQDPKDLISSLLTVEPSERIDARSALKHTFFTLSAVFEHNVTARRKMRRAIIVVRAAVRLRRLHLTPQPISLVALQRDPYRVRNVRKMLDACAFRIYGHWVKKGEEQNRAALFQNSVKIEIKTLHSSLMARA